MTHFPPQLPRQPAHDKGGHLSTEARFPVLGPEKAGKAKDPLRMLKPKEKLQKSRGVRGGSCRAHSTRLDFSEFINYGWSLD